VKKHVLKSTCDRQGWQARRILRTPNIQQPNTLALPATPSEPPRRTLQPALSQNKTGIHTSTTAYTTPPSHQAQQEGDGVVGHHCAVRHQLVGPKALLQASKTIEGGEEGRSNEAGQEDGKAKEEGQRKEARVEARVKHGEQPLRQSSSREGGAAPAAAAAPLLHTSAWHHTLTEPPSQPFQPCMVHLTSQLLPRPTPFDLPWPALCWPAESSSPRR
jgi:hypothetical protein